MQKIYATAYEKENGMHIHHNTTATDNTTNNTTIKTIIMS